MKGIILAGGTGTRLHPITISCCKQLLPIYDKPLIYYSLSTLMKMKVKDILIISTPNDKCLFEKLLKDGKQWGINLSYAVQMHPKGIAEAFIIGEKFISQDNVSLILGDNIFGAIDFQQIKIPKKINGGIIFGYEVPDPEKYGVIEFDKNNKIKNISEKPRFPKSNKICPGLYIYNSNVTKIAKKLKPSKRKELEITDVNNFYIRKKKLKLKNLNMGTVWLDAGNSEALFQAAQYVKTIQERHNILIGSPEIISFQNHWISKQGLAKLIKSMNDNDYKKNLNFFYKNI